MSWSLTYPEIKSLWVADAKAALEQNTSPQSIKDYVIAAIDGLMARYGDDVTVTVTGHGHLCDVANSGSYDVTTATIEVRKG